MCRQGDLHGGRNFSKILNVILGHKHHQNHSQTVKGQRFICNKRGQNLLGGGGGGGEKKAMIALVGKL